MSFRFPVVDLSIGDAIEYSFNFYWVNVKWRPHGDKLGTIGGEIIISWRSA